MVAVCEITQRWQRYRLTSTEGCKYPFFRYLQLSCALHSKEATVKTFLSCKHAKIDKIFHYFDNSRLLSEKFSTHVHNFFSFVSLNTHPYFSNVDGFHWL